MHIFKNKKKNIRMLNPGLLAELEKQRELYDRY